MRDKNAAFYEAVRAVATIGRLPLQHDPDPTASSAEGPDCEKRLLDLCGSLAEARVRSGDDRLTLTKDLSENPLYPDAAKLVDACWPAIEKIATCLLEVETLPSEHVAEIYAGLRCAYHESGHVIVHRIYGYEVGFATITPVPQENTAGETRIFLPPELYPDANSDESILRKWLVIKMAGMVAQHYFDSLVSASKESITVPEYTQDLFAQAGQDSADALELLWHLQNKGFHPKESTRIAAERTVELVVEYWVQIEEFAKILFDAKSMVSHQIRSALQAIFSKSAMAKE